MKDCWKASRLPIHMMHEYLKNALPWIPEDEVVLNFTPQHNSEFAQFELGIFKATARIVGKVAVAMKRRRTREQQQPPPKAYRAGGLKILWADLDEELEDVNDLFKPSPAPIAVAFVPRGWKPDPDTLAPADENVANVDSDADTDATPRQAWYTRMPPPPPKLALDASALACTLLAEHPSYSSSHADEEQHSTAGSPFSPSVNSSSLRFGHTADVLAEDACILASSSDESGKRSSKAENKEDQNGASDGDEEMQETNEKIEKSLRTPFSVKTVSVLFPILSLDCYDPVCDADNEGTGTQLRHALLLGEEYEKDQDVAPSADFKCYEFAPFSWSSLPLHLQDPAALVALDVSSAEPSHLKPQEVADIGVASRPSAHMLQSSISNISITAVLSSPILPPAYEKYEYASLHKREPCQSEDEKFFDWDALPPYLTGPTTFQPVLIPEPTSANPNPFQDAEIGYPSPPIDRDFELQWSLSELSLAAIASPPQASAPFEPSPSAWPLVSSADEVEDEVDDIRVPWAAETKLQTILLRDWKCKFDGATTGQLGSIGRMVATLGKGVNHVLGHRRR